MTPNAQSRLEDIQTTYGNFSVHKNKPLSTLQPPMRNIYQVPFGQLVPNFVGRTDILAKIELAFNSSQDCGSHVVVLRGMGGQGKSQIALEYCRRAKEEGMNAIFWIDATSEVTVRTSFQNIAEKLVRNGEFVTDSEMVHYVVEKLRGWQAPWLMVFDNYDDLTGFNNVREFLPECNGRQIIVTSRHPSSEALPHDAVSKILIEGLADDDALDLFWRASHAGKRNFDVDEIAEAKRVVHTLSSHPLAITQAGSYVKQQNIRIGDFMDHYGSKRENLLHDTPLPPHYGKENHSEAEKETYINVFTTSELSLCSFMESMKDGREKAHLLILFAFFHLGNISEDLFVSYCKQAQVSEGYSWPAQCLLPCLGEMRRADPNQREQNSRCQMQWDSGSLGRMLDKAMQSSLVQFRTQEDGIRQFSLHSLARDWIRLRVSELETQYYSILSGKIIMGYLVDNYHQRTFKINKPKQYALFTHINEYLQNTARYSDNIELDNVDDWIGSFLVRCGRYKEGEFVRKRLLSSRQANSGLQDASTLQVMNHLANLYDLQERFELAEDMCRRTLKGKQSVLGPRHQGTLRTMADLAWILYRKGEFMVAEKIARGAVEGQDSLGKSRQNTFNCLDTLAQILRAQGKHAEAMIYQQRSLIGRRKKLGDEHPATLIAAINVGSIFQDLGQFDCAEEYMAKTLVVQRRDLGKEHPDTLLCANNLALLYLDQGRLKLAEESMERLVEINKRLLGPSHSFTLKSTANLARILKSQRRFVDALTIYEEVIVRLEKTLGSGHPYNITLSEEFEALRVEMEAGAVDKALPLVGMRGGYLMKITLFLVVLILNFLGWYCCW
ncbi:hypothetical protein HYALB_00004043 [Hymenoscyphus albidus]|uniref:NB-ARC domain-containing protein n=1 Tax=Hymenoscyphus albidus TaxID=595503 RepID=A0A9N9M1Z4_9HELO|nr:hypothetical protein HYALB_00004043 [Hymenoscyphus albidus]